jgi:hypothetical protein
MMRAVPRRRLALASRRVLSRAALAGALALASACTANSSSGTGTTDTIPPTVTDQGPKTNVPVNAALAVAFSEALDCTTVTTGTFQIGGVAGTVSCSDASATFNPAAELAFATTYTVTLATGANGIKDLAGNSLAGTNSWNFTTAAVPDTTPPTVTSQGPTANVPVNASITVGFSEALECASVTTSTFQVGGVAGAVSCSNASATFDPTANLAFATTYTLTLATGANGIKDLAGNSLAGTNSWNFTTAAVPDTTPPTVTSQGPITNVPVNASLTVGFSEALDCTSVTTSTFQIGGAAGAVSCSNASATFNPTTDLAYTTTYTVTLATGASGIKDLAGNGLAGTSSWTFTTAAAPTLSFMAYGDSRAGADCSGNEVHIALVNRMVNEAADFVFHLGDMIVGFNRNSNWVENGDCTGPTSFGSFKSMIAPLQNKTPAAGLPTFYFPVLGNHDDNWGSGWYPDPFGHGFCDVFDPVPLVPNHTQQPYYLDPAATRYNDGQFYSLACSKTVSDVYPRFIHYSFNHRNSHFVVLRVNNDSFDIEACNSCGPNRSNYGDYYNIHQLDWLRADLAAASANTAIDHIFVFLHAPLFTSSWGHSANVSAQTLSKEFSNHKVKIVFSGHNHVYERSKRVFVSAAFPNGTEDNVNGTVYVVTGGGGSDFHGFDPMPWFIAARSIENHYMKIEVINSTISVTAVKADGTVIDSFTR